MKLLDEKSNHVVEYKLNYSDVNWFAELWEQVDYSKLSEFQILGWEPKHCNV